MALEAVRVSVRALVESVMLSGDLSPMGFGGLKRMQEGQRGHALVQAASEARREVPVSAVVAGARVELTVQGRIDLLTLADGAARIEEIKTTHVPPDRVEADPLHWAQAEAYAHIVCRDNALDAADVALLYWHVPSGDMRRFERTVSASDLEARFLALAGAYIDRLEALAAWHESRDASIEALAFPFTNYRAGQRTMAAQAYVAFRDARPLLVCAPTGIGKTAAALFPALKALGAGIVTRVFYVTARTTARQSAQRALAFMREHGLHARGIALTAKEKLCAHPGAGCRPEACPRARGYYDRLPAALREAARRESWGREEISSFCEARELCPFEFQLDLSLQCDVIIGDYNYAFDPRVKLRRYFENGAGGGYALLVDEAHHLPDRAREMFSADIGQRALGELRKATADLGRKHPLHKALRALRAGIGALAADVERGTACVGGERIEEEGTVTPDGAADAMGEGANGSAGMASTGSPEAIGIEDSSSMPGASIEPLAGDGRARGEAIETTVYPPEAPGTSAHETGDAPGALDALACDAPANASSGARRDTGDAALPDDEAPRPDAAPANARYAAPALPADLLIAAQSFCDECESLLDAGDPAPPALLDALFEVRWFLAVAERIDDRYRLLQERDGRHRALRLLCLDAGPEIRAALKPMRSCVFFSATLSPLAFYRDLFGLDERAGLLSLPSPFPPERFLVLAHPLPTTYAARASSLARVARAIECMARAHVGNYLAFFPSYRYLQDVRAALDDEGLCAFEQDRGLSEEAREAFLERFQPGPSVSHIGFAVMGSLFGEGVDLPGERLHGVAIVGVGLPQMGGERDALREWYGRTRERGFEYAYQYPGMCRVLQAMGRVIRDEGDRGVALLIDERFLRRDYAALMPPHWRARTAWREADIVREMRAFWAMAEA